MQASPAAEPERADLHRVGEGSPHEHRRHRRHRSLQGGRHVSPHYSFDQGWARVPECVRVSRLYTFFKRCCVSRLRAHFCPLKKIAHSWFCVIAHCVSIFLLCFFRAPFSFGPLSRPLAGCQTKCAWEGGRKGGCTTHTH